MTLPPFALQLLEFEDAPAPLRAVPAPRLSFFARDLDAADSPPRETEPEPDPLPLMLDAARREGFVAGLAQGHEDARAAAESLIATTLSRAQDMLGDAQAAACAQAAEAAEAIARATLAAMTAALPVLAERLGEAETVRFAEALLPLLAEEPSVTLHVAAALADAVAARLAADRRLDVLGDPALSPGDVRLTWRGGNAERKGAAARAAVAAMLTDAGLV